MRVFSDVRNAGLLLPKKALYTVKDCERVIIDSLFAGGRTLTTKEASFVVRCSAAHHDTWYSKKVRSFGQPKLGTVISHTSEPSNIVTF